MRGGIFAELAKALLLGRKVRLVEVGDDGLAILRGTHPFECDCPICREHNFAADDARREALTQARAFINRALDSLERE